MQSQERSAACRQTNGPGRGTAFQARCVAFWRPQSLGVTVRVNILDQIRNDVQGDRSCGYVAPPSPC